MNFNFLLGIIFIFLFNLSFSQNKLYLYQNETEHGLVDREGNLKSKTDFDSIVDLKADEWTNTKAFLLQKDGKFGLMNDLGDIIFPVKYENIFCKNDSCQLTENGKKGYALLTGKVLIPNTYDDLGFISDRKIKALKDGKWGFLNLNNEWIIPPKFDKSQFEVFDFREGLAKICIREKENSCGYINTEGFFVVPQIYDEYSGDFHNGLAKTSLGGKLNYINKAGKIAFKSDWNDTSNGDFSFGVANVSKNCRQFDDYGVCENYLINTEGKNILPLNSETVRSFPEENYTIVRDRKTQKVGVVNNLGKIIVPLKFLDAGNFEGPFDWISVTNQNSDQYEMTGFFDRQGKQITACIYSICGSFNDENDPESENFICIERQNGEGRGALNDKGKEVVPPDYENVDFADHVFVVSKLSRKPEIGGIYDPSCGYIDLSGNIFIPLEYKSCSKFNDGLAVVYDKKGWKIINKKNQIIKDLLSTYSRVSQYSNGLAIVEKGGKFGMLNRAGELQIPIIYDYVYHYNDVIQVKENNKYGIINSSGQIIIPSLYDNVSLSTCNGKVFGKNGNQFFWYSLSGERLNDRIPLAQCYEDKL